MPKNWTEEQREAAARRARLKRPWQYATGPRTVAGKRVSSRNALKHGFYSFEKTVLRWYMRLCALRLNQLKALAKNRAHKTTLFQKTGNELSSKRRRPSSYPMRCHPGACRVGRKNNVFGLPPRGKGYKNSLIPH